ncbi:signal recognition particle-docking protein FtsY [Litoreibacter albidus]|uniref:signal recognition particle-docking protein FtsY n=1 Tax=Litoreibacter albidus TaxID=670155 RepID=UPI0037362C7F
MSFFKKLKTKLFKSSSKLEEGLDAIVEDGGVEEDVNAEAPKVEAPVDDAAQREAEQRQAEADAEAQRQAEAEAAARAAAEAETAARLTEDARIASEADAQADADEAAAKKAQAAAARAAQQAEEARAAQAREEAALAAEQARQAEAAKQAQEAEAERKAAARALEELEVEKAAEKAASEAKAPGLLGRLMGRKEQKTVVRRELDDDMLEALEELLIASDMGVDTSLRVTANMAEGRFGKKLSTQEIKDLLASEITKIMEPVAKPMPIYPKRPQVVLVVGVNGSGKTTTIGKLALQFSNAGKKVVIAAGDTFRAAAVEQLQVWGERAGVPVLTAPEGSDPASLAYEAMQKAEADGADLLLIDTAGRLQNRTDLMEELAKIVRVIRKRDETAPHNTLLVLDATTGQNALNQVEVFRQISDVSGLVMTKLDGTAKGGVLVALADKFGLPIHAIGVGEQIDDLAPFDPEEFAQALTGTATE